MECRDETHLKRSDRFPPAASLIPTMINPFRKITNGAGKRAGVIDSRRVRRLIGRRWLGLQHDRALRTLFWLLIALVGYTYLG
jgi:hypothetical protein